MSPAWLEFYFETFNYKFLLCFHCNCCFLCVWYVQPKPTFDDMSPELTALLKSAREQQTFREHDLLKVPFSLAVFLVVQLYFCLALFNSSFRYFIACLLWVNKSLFSVDLISVFLCMGTSTASCQTYNQFSSLQLLSASKRNPASHLNALQFQKLVSVSRFVHSEQQIISASQEPSIATIIGPSSNTKDISRAWVLLVPSPKVLIWFMSSRLLWHPCKTSTLPCIL